MDNLIILGTGIAGCTAAIYAARANLNPLVISGPEDGGQLTLTAEVENFPGFPEGIKGPELVQLCKKQAERFGAKFENDLVSEFNPIKNGYELKLASGKNLQTKSVIIATGASAKWLGLPSEKKYQGRGVSACATCDGAFYKGKEVIVIGGGDSAMEESLFLTKFASKITIIHRKDSFRASKIMQQRVGAKLKDNRGKVTDFKCEGIFLAIGHAPNTKVFQGKLNLDGKGYLQADRFMHTNLPGVFAAGDVQDIRYRQAITAAGTGCQAAMEAEKYLAEHSE
ncbi:FAD-dependent oxidoreductase [Candidatus Woesearchaeota archaeon]|nr:FAD-dependent oxidoreductase [Candidatus Woesearchaeota archaeon]